ncbi:hypothetical protein [Pleurocapsa sp. FMAR1]|uniref:hypothetical protein n=1 Tax=Pleurocapsa sp. FMAR1 TaxID=3040204 RepID=UPI0029C915DF|nr:hypothetical protein [Pleurocapsa sp. FMAR1]
MQGKIQAQEIFAALTIAMSKTVEINVTTCIENDLDRATQSPSTERFATRINLLNGTVEHEVDLELIDNPAYGELQQWHIEQVKQKQGFLIKNLASLEEMRRLLSPSRLNK